MANKAQKEYAAKFLQKNPNHKVLYLNAKKNEFFTDLDFANNSLDKDKKGNVSGKIETFNQGKDIDISGDDLETSGEGAND